MDNIPFESDPFEIYRLIEVFPAQPALVWGELADCLPGILAGCRLSYRIHRAATLTIRFEMASPGQPEAFSVYTEGNAHRK